MAELTLYSMPSSGNSYKVRLLLAHLGLPYQHIGLEYLTPELSEAHEAGRLPLKKLPVLELEDGQRIPESNAILCFLADKTDWLSDDPIKRAQTLAWMFWEQNQHEGVIAVRAALRTYENRKHLATPHRMQELLDRGQELLAQMDDRLKTNDWIATDAPSIADISLFAYTHSAGTKGGYDMSRFRAVSQWLGRVAALPGHVRLTDIPT